MPRVSPEFIEAAKRLGGKVGKGTVLATHLPDRFEYRLWGLTEEEIVKIAAFIETLRKKG